MKNLVTRFRKGEPLKSAKLLREESYKYDWDRRHNSQYHTTDGIWPWKRIKRICKAYVGKPFADAFAEYCKQVPVYQQKFFLEEFNNKGRPQSEYWNYYYTDKQGRIQFHQGEYYKKKAKNKKVYYYSDDYKAEKRHKDTGEVMPRYSFMRKGKHAEENYIDTIVSGYFLEFSSVKDPEYIRLTADQAKRRKAEARRKEKEAEAKVYSFMTKAEKEAKAAKEAEKEKRNEKDLD